MKAKVEQQPKEDKNEIGNSRSPAKQIKFKNQTEALFDGLSNEIESRTVDSIVEEYAKNPFYKTKIKLILGEFDKNLQQAGVTYEEFLTYYRKTCGQEPGSFEIKNPHLETLKVKIGKANIAYATRLLEIKERIKALKGTAE